LRFIVFVSVLLPKLNLVGKKINQGKLWQQ